jgi:hypothetical protein
MNIWELFKEKSWETSKFMMGNGGNHGKLWSKKWGISPQLSHWVGQIGGFPARCEEKYGINIRDFEGTVSRWVWRFAYMKTYEKNHGYVGLPMISRMPASPFKKHTHPPTIVRNMWFHPLLFILLSGECFNVKGFNQSTVWGFCWQGNLVISPLFYWINDWTSQKTCY